MSNVKGLDEAQSLNFDELVAQYHGSVLRISITINSESCPFIF